MKAGQLTQKQRIEFTEAFYSQTDNPLTCAEDDCPSYPWGCPWDWREDYDLHGNSVAEMAKNFFAEVEKEIHYHIEMEKEED